MIDSDIDLVLKKLQDPPQNQPNFYSITPPPNALKAAVLLLLYPSNSYIHTVFVKRVVNPNDKHSGQIGLPGGKFIPNDLELKHTALRESQEEIGINPSQIQLIQGLSPLYIPVSNFLVKTFIGYSPTSLSFIPEPREVDKILEVPLSEILNQFSENKKKLEQNILPEFNFNEFKIWGATALILHEFVELISN